MEIIINKNRLLANTFYHNIITIYHPVDALNGPNELGGVLLGEGEGFP